MKQQGEKVLFLIMTIILLSSCSNELSTKENLDASRNIVPSIMASEIQIGNRIWTTKNLSTNRYRNGDIIPYVEDSNEWANLTTGAWCYFDNDPEFGIERGKLYNWYAITDPRGLAPAGWHIPTDTEVGLLQFYLGGASVAGTKIKKISPLWRAPFTATNSSGFSAIPAGARGYIPTTWYASDNFAIWWTSTSISLSEAGKFYVQSSPARLDRNSADKRDGYSVRCVKN